MQNEKGYILHQIFHLSNYLSFALVHSHHMNIYSFLPELNLILNNYKISPTKINNFSKKAKLLLRQVI